MANSVPSENIVSCAAVQGTRSQRWRRDLWNIFWGRLPSRRLRRMLLHKLFAELGTGVFVGAGVKIFHPWNISIDRNSAINPDCIIDARGGTVSIGDNVDIGMHTHIWTMEHDPNDKYHGTRGSNVSIEDHVWIATRVTILPGVRIGRGAVVGCGSIVTRDVPENAIVAGIPAKRIGERENDLTYEISYNPRFR